MAYRDFTLKDLDKKFGLESQVTSLFDISKITEIPVSEWLNGSLERGREIQLNT